MYILMIDNITGVVWGQEVGQGQGLGNGIVDDPGVVNTEEIGSETGAEHGETNLHRWAAGAMKEGNYE